MKTIPAEIQPILSQFKKSVQEMYGDRLVKLLLYGSYARGDYDKESDIDMLVVLKDEHYSPFTERTILSALMMDLVYNYNYLLVPKPIKEGKFYDPDSIFLYFVKKDAIEI